MLRFVSVSILTLFLISACVSPSTKKELDARESAVATLEEALEAAEGSGSGEIAEIKAQLAKAQAELKAIQEEALRERISSGADMVEKGAQIGEPIVAWLFPPAMVILSLIGELAGSVKSRYGKKEGE